MDLQFDKDTHTYTYGDRVLPSVTQVLKSVGLIDETWFSDESRDRGEAVHEAAQYLDEDDLDWSTIAPEYELYLRAYEKFLQDARPEWEHIEYRVIDRLYGYAGTVDRIGEMLGKRIVLDLKTGAPQAWHGLQLAGYKYAYGRYSGFTRYGLQLKSDGNYKLHKYTDRQDIKIFRCALSVHNWKGNK